MQPHRLFLRLASCLLVVLAATSSAADIEATARESGKGDGRAQGGWLESLIGLASTHSTSQRIQRDRSGSKGPRHTAVSASLMEALISDRRAHGAGTNATDPSALALEYSKLQEDLNEARELHRLTESRERDLKAEVANIRERIHHHRNRTRAPGGGGDAEAATDATNVGAMAAAAAKKQAEKDYWRKKEEKAARKGGRLADKGSEGGKKKLDKDRDGDLSTKNLDSIEIYTNKVARLHRLPRGAARHHHRHRRRRRYHRRHPSPPPPPSPPRYHRITKVKKKHREEKDKRNAHKKALEKMPELAAKMAKDKEAKKLRVKVRTTTTLTNLTSPTSPHQSYHMDHPSPPRPRPRLSTQF